MAWYTEIQPEDFSEDLKFVDLWAVPIPTRLCSQALTLVAADDLRLKYPWLKRLGHYKRNGVTPPEGPLMLLPDPQLPSLLTALLVGVLKEAPRPHRVRVPAAPPLTKVMAERYSQVWPVTYRQPSWRPIQFKDESRVRAAVLTAFKDCPSISKAGCTCWCRITNGRRTVVEATAGASSHPLYNYHASMIALHQLSALVLRLQALETCPKAKSQHPDVRERPGRRIPQDAESTATEGDEETNSSVAVPPIESQLRQGVKRPPPLSPASSSSLTAPPPCPWADGLFLLEPEPAIDSLQYYAKDFTVFLDREPCVMCAMALLHSRVSCVVFRDKPSSGRVGGFSSLRLHASSKLNHTFRVLQLLIE